MLPVLLMLGCNSRCTNDGGTCRTDNGRYYAATPKDWDGETALPTILHFHGWNGSPDSFFGSDEVMDAYSAAGVLVVMPEGAEETWTVPNMGLEGSGRDEMAFVEEVLKDVRSRWPVDDDRVYVSGHSLGASMAYHVACEMGEQFAALAPSSGGFWAPMPASCPSPPIPVCHIHGVEDTTWPYEGRVVTEGAEEGTQVHVDDDVAFWLAHNNCSETSTTYTDDILTCEKWADCADGIEVNLCTHPGGHSLPTGWVDRETDWMLSFPQ